MVPAVSTLRRGLALGRLGIDIARARRLTAPSGREAARRAIASRMGRMRGLPQKIGQILSLADLNGDASPYGALTERAPAAPAGDAFGWIEDALGAPVARVFAALDRDGVAASLGQVHAGRLHDGRRVAVKVQYPGVAEALDADLAALGLLAVPLSGGPGFDLRAYRRELRARLLEELDYEAEAATLRRMAARAEAVPGLITPAPVDEYCRPRLLTMSWIEGGPVQTTADWPLAARHAAAQTLVDAFVRGCFEWREVHADPHAGNVRFDRRGGKTTVGLIDFGCVKQIAEGDAARLRQLAEDGADLSAAAALESYGALGFDVARLEPMADRLPAVTRVLFEPFQTGGPFDVARWRLSERLAETLGEHRWTFRAAGPASLLFLIRALHGVVAYTRTLDAQIDWATALRSLERPQTPAATTPPRDAGDPVMHTRSLFVQVTRAGQQVARLSFPAKAVDFLADLVPDEHRARIAARGLDVDALARDTARRGYPPGEVVALCDGDTTIRVWLD